VHSNKGPPRSKEMQEIMQKACATLSSHITVNLSLPREEV